MLPDNLTTSFDATGQPPGRNALYALFDKGYSTFSSTGSAELQSDGTCSYSSTSEPGWIFLIDAVTGSVSLVPSRAAEDPMNACTMIDASAGY